MLKKIFSCLMVAVMLVTMVSVTAFAEGENWTEANSREEGSIVQSGDPFYFTNYLSEELDIKIKVFEDLELERLIDSDGDGYTSVVTVDDQSNENGNSIEYYLPVDGTFRIEAINDETSNSDDPSVTYILYDAYAEIDNKYKNEMKHIEDQLKKSLNSCDKSYPQEILDPAVLDVDGWTEESAKNFAYSMGTVSTLTGLDWSLKVDETFAYLYIKYYSDEDCKNQIEIKDINIGEPCYIKMSYSFYYNVGDFELNRYVYNETPIEYTVTYTDAIGKDSPEIEKIKENIEFSLGDNSIVYDDLAWVNVLEYTGQDALAPSIKNAGAILNERNPELYEKLVGDTDLEIALSYGGAGGGGFISHAVFDVTALYTVDGVLCFNSGYMQDASGELSAWMPIYMSKVMYVSEGIDDADDRAKAAEDRIKKYMGSDDFKVEIKYLDKEALKTYSVNNERIAGSVTDLDWNAIDLSDAKAAYLTEHGIAFYNDISATAKENFIGICRLTEEDVLAMKGMDSDGTVDYIKIEERIWNDETGEEEDKAYQYSDVDTYQAYTLTLDKDEEQTYFYIIGTKPQAEIEKLDKESFADWKDKESGIITEGENGQVVGDFYTKIRKTGNGEIKIITQKIKANKVNSYDIEAYTNFKSEKIEKLGDGKVKVKIPLEEFGKENLKAFYYDQNGNVVYLDYTIEEEEGIEYVCFTTNHFSTYGIAEIEADSSGIDGDGDNEDPVGGEENSENTNGTGQNESNKDSATDTSDKSNMMIPVIAGILALAVGGATMFARRRNN